MNAGQPSPTYRLIVVFDDGVRVEGLSGLSKKTAEEFQARMLELTGFKTVLVEAEDNPLSPPTVAGAAPCQRSDSGD
jgi:hypothetical protein